MNEEFYHDEDCDCEECLDRKQLKDMIGGTGRLSKGTSRSAYREVSNSEQTLLREKRLLQFILAMDASDKEITCNSVCRALPVPDKCDTRFHAKSVSGWFSSLVQKRKILPDGTIKDPVTRFPNTRYRVNPELRPEPRTEKRLVTQKFLEELATLLIALEAGNLHRPLFDSVLVECFHKLYRDKRHEARKFVDVAKEEMEQKFGCGCDLGRLHGVLHKHYTEGR